MTDLDELNTKEAELRRQLADIEAEKKVILNAKRNEALDIMRKYILEYAFSAQDLGFGAPSKKTRKKPKTNKTVTFRDTETNMEWDGDLKQKGRKPGWIMEKIADGTIEQYRVKEELQPLG